MVGAETTKAEVEGRGFCEIHGHFDGEECSSCVDEGRTGAELVPVAPKPRRPRGFAAMDRAKVSEIARMGGQAAHVAGTAHEFTSEEGKAAGRKGGHATHAKRRAGKS